MFERKGRSNSKEWVAYYSPSDTVFSVIPSTTPGLITLCGFSLQAKGRIIDVNAVTGQIGREYSTECAFDIAHAGDRIVYADWRIRKIVSVRNKMILGSGDVLFKDYCFKKSRLQVLHKVRTSDPLARSCTGSIMISIICLQKECS